MKNLLVATTLLVVANSSAIAYELIDLGPNVEPKAINNSRVVVGSSNTDQYPATAFQWSSASYGIELIDGTSANAVNENGQITGSTITGAFILDGNNYRDWSDYAAFGINQSGAVAGYKVGKNPYQPRSLPYNPAIFNGKKWDVSDIAGIYPRGTREGVYADRYILNSINADGYTVGYRHRYGLAGSAAILLDPNVTINDKADVVYLPGDRAADLNNKNMIVGTTGSSSSTVPATYSQAYLFDYTMGSLTVLPVLQGGLRSKAYGINEGNQVVGSSETLVGSTTVNHAFLWNQTDGVTIDLNDLNDWAAEGWVLTSASAINDNGDIVGNGFLHGVAHGFLLTNGLISAPVPVQEPVPVKKGKGKSK